MSIVHGLWQLPWWGYILVILVFTQITIAAVTLYLHRNQAHRAIHLHPLLAHFFRFWLWLTTAMNTREWVAVHRKHHARVESEDDPHSPQVRGIHKVLLEGAELYKKEAGNRKTCEDYGHETPDDWMERHIYRSYRDAGILIMFLMDFALFGVVGITIWAIQMMWIPVFAAGVINGVGHWGGYRNFETQDASTNILPWGVFIGGEELHNNHHAFASSARFSSKWWELDIGWFYIRLLGIIRLAQVKKLAPVLSIDDQKIDLDVDTVRAVITNRLHIMSRYTKHVVGQVYREEKIKSCQASRRILRRGKRLVTRAEHRLDERARRNLDEMLRQNVTMREVYEFGQRLQALWNEKSASYENLLSALREWCEQAEATGIEALQEFARQLRSYTLQPA